MASALLEWQTSFLFRKSSKPEKRVHGFVAKHQLRHTLAYCRSMFVAVTGASAQQPYVRRARMPVHDEILVGRILVLAHASLHQWRPFHPRESKFHVLARSLNGVSGGSSIAIGGIKCGAALVIGKF